jgi:glutathione S-transferase
VELIGQYDSPFVRRVAIAMRLMEVAYDHRPWSVFRDADRIAAHNPLLRVPVLVLADGQSIIESQAIIAFLEGSGSRSLWPGGDADRLKAVRIASLAVGAADKAVSLVYEKLLHDHPSEQWIERCHAQISAAFDELEGARAAAQSPYLFGRAIGHSDIALACLLRFVGEAHADAYDLGARWPALAAHSASCEALPVFTEVSQPFAVAAPPVAS